MLKSTLQYEKNSRFIMILLSSNVRTIVLYKFESSKDKSV